MFSANVLQSSYADAAKSPCPERTPEQREAMRAAAAVAAKEKEKRVNSVRKNVNSRRKRRKIGRKTKRIRRKKRRRRNVSGRSNASESVKTDGKRMTEERENARKGLNAGRERKKMIEDEMMIEIEAGSAIVIGRVRGIATRVSVNASAIMIGIAIAMTGTITEIETLVIVITHLIQMMVGESAKIFFLGIE